MEEPTWAVDLDGAQKWSAARAALDWLMDRGATFMDTPPTSLNNEGFSFYRHHYLKQVVAESDDTQWASAMCTTKKCKRLPAYQDDKCKQCSESSPDFLGPSDDDTDEDNFIPRHPRRILNRMEKLRKAPKSTTDKTTVTGYQSRASTLPKKGGGCRRQTVAIVDDSSETDNQAGSSVGVEGEGEMEQFSRAHAARRSSTGTDWRTVNQQPLPIGENDPVEMNEESYDWDSGLKVPARATHVLQAGTAGYTGGAVDAEQARGPVEPGNSKGVGLAGDSSHAGDGGNEGVDEHGGVGWIDRDGGNDGVDGHEGVGWSDRDGGNEGVDGDEGVGWSDRDGGNEGVDGDGGVGCSDGARGVTCSDGAGGVTCSDGAGGSHEFVSDGNVEPEFANNYASGNGGGVDGAANGFEVGGRCKKDAMTSDREMLVQSASSSLEILAEISPSGAIGRLAPMLPEPHATSSDESCEIKSDSELDSFLKDAAMSPS